MHVRSCACSSERACACARAYACLPKHRWGIFCPFFGPLRAMVYSGQHGTIAHGPSVQLVQYQDVQLLQIKQRCWFLPLCPSSLL